MSATKPFRPKSIDLADGVMLGVIAMWAGNNVLTKSALEHGLRPLTYVSIRFALVMVVLWGIILLRGQWKPMRRVDLPRFLASGLCGFALYNLLFVVGLGHTSAFSASVLIALAPVFILIISALLRIERVRPFQWVGVALSLAGVAVFIGDKLLAGKPAIGDTLNILAALCFAIYGLTTGRLVAHYGPSLTTAWSVTIGLIFIFPFAARTMIEQNWGAIDRFSWITMIYAALISMMLAYSLWGWAIARAGAGRSVPYLFLIPVFTGLFAVVFRGDRLEAAQLVGGAIALTGVAIARISARSVRREPNTLLEETNQVPDTRRKPHALPGP